VCDCVCEWVCVVCLCCGVCGVFVFVGAGGVLPHVASESQNFIVCNTSSLMWLLSQCVYELMTSGDLSPHPTFVLRLAEICMPSRRTNPASCLTLCARRPNHAAQLHINSSPATCEAKQGRDLLDECKSASHCFVVGDPMVE